MRPGPGIDTPTRINSRIMRDADTFTESLFTTRRLDVKFSPHAPTYRRIASKLFDFVKFVSRLSCQFILLKYQEVTKILADKANKMKEILPDSAAVAAVICPNASVCGK
ncbi:hypothetical protein D9M68_449530 [compost metagenome]